MQSENVDSNDKRSELLALQEAQRRLELCLASAGLGIWTYNVATNEFWADDRAKQLHGHAPHEVHTFAEAGVNIHPEDRDRTQAAIAQVIQDCSKLQLEYRVIWRDGSVRGIASYAEFVPAGSQNGGIFYGVAQDITDRLQDEGDRKRAEEKLRLSEEKYRTLFNSIDEGFCITELVYDSEGNIEDIFFREVNQAYERLGGLTNVVGKSIEEVLPSLKQHWKNIHTQIAKTGEPIRVINYAKDIDRWFDTYLAMLGGSNKYVAVVINDITDRKRTEANLAFLAEISQDLTYLTNIDATINALSAKIGEYFQVSRCNFAEINEAAGEAVITHEWHAAGLGDISGDFISDEFFQVARAGEMIVVRDTGIDSRTDDTAYAPLDVRSFVTAPFVRDGQWLAVMSISDSKPRDWREDEIELMRELTSRIWTWLERARTEVALRVSEEKYRTLFNAMDEAYAVVEVIPNEEGRWSDFRFLEVNPAFVKHTSMEYPVGRTATQILGTPNPRWAEIYGQVSETDEAVRIEITEDSLNRVFDLNIFRLDNPESRRVAVLFTDITARKRAEDDRNRAQEAMRTFFSNVSHEFRTPLTLLLSSIQDALSDLAHNLSPVQRSQLQLAHRNASSLLKLVNTLLDVSRIESGRIQAVYEPTDLATLTTELASSFESAIEQAGLQLAIDCPPLPELIYVDRSMWEKIVLNLLSNAFKFTFAGEIAVRLRSNSERVELIIQDTGIGITAAAVPHLFDRFYQVKGAKGRSLEGSGIGLSLVQELVKVHGGTIQVSSVEGEGSYFTVSIPIGFTHLPLEQIGLSCTGEFSQDAFGQSEDGLQNPPLPSTATEASAYVEEALGWLPEKAEGESQRIENREPRLESRANLLPSASCLLPSTLRIFLVDDNAQMRAYLKRLLDERWQVETAANGALALTQIQQNPPDLVLTDIIMPEMDGLQLLQALRANPQTKTIPIILLSARVGEEATIEGLETGADDYLIKPFSARELMARVETHLQLALLRQEGSANRFKSEFLLTVTHELQAPLALILGWTRLLQTRSFDADTTAQALATIERSATIEAKLIKDLLDVSGLLSGKVQLKSQFLELAPLLQSAITQFHPAAKAKQIQLIETILSVPKNVVADGSRIKQILANLLDNAIKFTPEGGQVTIRLECVDSEVHITVADTGIGIPPDFLPYVFDRFTQAEVPSRNSPGGVGIGLAIARLLVELHKGTIEVASEGEGRGTTFMVRLPLRMDNS